MKLTRIGVFYDGGYFARVSDYYRYGHERQARLSIAGIHAFVRHEVAAREQVEIRYSQIVDAHYFRGRFPAHESEKQQKLIHDRRFDDVLMRAGVTTHYLPRGHGGEKGIDVWLALEALELAIYKHFDVIVLVTGDGDYMPLARKLNTLGTRVMLLAWDCEWLDRFGTPISIRTSQMLIEEVTYPVMMHALINDRSKQRDAVINSLFLPSVEAHPEPRAETRAETRATPLSHYQSSMGQTPEEPEEVDSPPVTGVVYSIHDTYGFVADAHRTTWFFHQSNLIDVPLADLQVNEPVQFRIDDGPKGAQATEVRRLDDTA